MLTVWHFGYFLAPDLSLYLVRVHSSLSAFLQKFDIWPMLVRVDYSPCHVDLTALRGGKYVELVNLIPWKVTCNCKICFCFLIDYTSLFWCGGLICLVAMHCEFPCHAHIITDACDEVWNFASCFWFKEVDKCCVVYFPALRKLFIFVKNILRNYMNLKNAFLMEILIFYCEFYTALWYFSCIIRHALIHITVTLQMRCICLK